MNGRLVRDRLVQHGLTEAYRNMMPPTVYPVVLLFLEMPYTEVDANVHPSKTEVRFRQQGFVHDFVRDTVRTALMKARPVPQFVAEIRARPTASQGLSPGALAATDAPNAAPDAGFVLQPPAVPPQNQSLAFHDAISVEANAADALGRVPIPTVMGASIPESNGGCSPAIPADEVESLDRPPLETLRPLGQVRESFILAVNNEGLWIIDQHVAHERVLFEKILRERAQNSPGHDGQRLLMPLIVELTPGQQAVFAEISEELQRNGFEVELFGTRTVAVKTAPGGVSASDVEKMLIELLDQFQHEEQVLNLEKIRARIAASIACHAAIKINMPLEQNKMEWLLKELAKTECPMSCPHGRPVVLKYSVKEIQKAFKRI